MPLATLRLLGDPCRARIEKAERLRHRRAHGALRLQPDRLAGLPGGFNRGIQISGIHGGNGGKKGPGWGLETMVQGKRAVNIAGGTHTKER